MTSPVKLWRNQENIRSLLGKNGKIVSWSMVYVPPGEFSEYAPYPVAVVELENSGRIVAQIVDYEQKDLVIGQKVNTVLRKIMEPDLDGVIPYGIKVKPIW